MIRGNLRTDRVKVFTSVCDKVQELFGDKYKVRSTQGGSLLNLRLYYMIFFTTHTLTLGIEVEGGLRLWDHSWLQQHAGWRPKFPICSFLTYCLHPPVSSVTLFCITRC